MLRLPSGLQNTRRPFARQLIGPVVPKHYVQPQRPIDTQRAKVLRLRIIFIFRAAITALCMVAVPALAENDKKTDDDKPADPDTGESTVEEKTLGLLPIHCRNTGSSLPRRISARPWQRFGRYQAGAPSMRDG